MLTFRLRHTRPQEIQVDELCRRQSMLVFAWRKATGFYEFVDIQLLLLFNMESIGGNYCTALVSKASYSWKSSEWVIDTT